jgi:hypothetical protein
LFKLGFQGMNVLPNDCFLYNHSPSIEAIKHRPVIVNKLCK